MTEVLFAPVEGSPKSQLKVVGHRADVFVKNTVFGPAHALVKFALFGGALLITMASIANPS